MVLLCTRLRERPEKSRLTRKTVHPHYLRLLRPWLTSRLYLSMRPFPLVHLRRKTSRLLRSPLARSPVQCLLLR